MKIRKNIASFLTFGIMLNNIYYNANSSRSETLSRYDRGIFFIIKILFFS